MASESGRTIVVALAAGLAVAVAKLVAGLITGSPAMIAEAAHSFADFGNDSFLLVAHVRSRRPPDPAHPLGYGREAYFWALFAALGVFLAGAAFSLREGIVSLIHPTTTSSFLLAYIVLGVSTVFDLISFRQSAGQMVAGARRSSESVLGYAGLTSDPMLRGVFNEDSVSMVGDVAAFIGLGVSQAIGSSAPQAIAAIAIGILLIRISLRLVHRNHAFLLGQPVTSSEQEQVRSFLAADPQITQVHELLVFFLGPGQVWVLARLSAKEDLLAPEIYLLVDRLESGLKRASKNVARVDIVTADR